MRFHSWFVGALVVLLAFGLRSTSSAQTPAGATDANAYDPIQTLLCLNYAMESLCKVISYNDIVILDQEYTNIINNINASKIKDDEIVSLFTHLMDRLTAQKIQDKQKTIVERNYERQVSNALYDAISGSTSGTSVIAINPFSLASSAIYGVGSSYFNYRKNLEEYKQRRQESEWSIDQQIMNDLNGIRKDFFEITVRLTNKYKWPDEYRLAENQVNDYVEALKDADSERRFRKLERMQADFRVFPPFWYYFGLAAQENKDEAKALECYSKFDETNKGIFRKDPFLAAVNMNRLALLGTKATAAQVHQGLDVILKNSQKSEWNNVLFAAMQYATLKEYKTADELLLQNIDEKHDVSLHTRIRAELKLDSKSTDEYAKITKDMVNNANVHIQDILYLCGKTNDKQLLKQVEKPILSTTLSLQSHLLANNDLVLSVPLRLCYDDMNVVMKSGDKDIPYSAVSVDSKNEMCLFTFSSILDVAKYVQQTTESEFTFRLIHKSYPIEVTFALHIVSETKQSGTVSKWLGSKGTYEDKSVVPKLVKVAIGNKEYRVGESGLII